MAFKRNVQYAGKPKRWRRHGFLCFAAAFGLIAADGLPVPAHAQQAIWGGSGSTTATIDYNTATNWSNPPGVVPSVSGTSANFADAGSLAVKVNSPITPDFWVFSANDAKPYTLTGAAVTFSMGLFDVAGVGISTITNISIANSLGGVGLLQQESMGTLTLSGTNGYTGATEIFLGTLALSGSGSISSSSSVTANSTFDISKSSLSFVPITTLAGSGRVFLGTNSLMITKGSTEFSGVISDGGGLEIKGGTQTLSGANTYTSATQIDSGATLALSGNGSISLSSSVTANGTFDISKSSIFSIPIQIQTLAGSGGVYLGANSLVITAGSTEFSGVIFDGGNVGGLEINGGTQTLSNVNTYSNATQIDSGATLALKGSGSISSSSSVAANGTFDISKSSLSSVPITTLAGSGNVYLGANSLAITAGSTEFSGVISDGGNSGGLEINHGTQTLSGANTYSNTTQIDSGATLALKGNGSISLSSSVTANGTFDI